MKACGNKISRDSSFSMGWATGICLPSGEGTFILAKTLRLALRLAIFYMADPGNFYVEDKAAGGKVG
jgi:hypothetical protein